jgi:DNA-binding beta-propeller fold protein YncE
MLMLGDPAFQPGGTTRAQAPNQPPQLRQSLLVLNKAESTLAVVDPATRKELKRFQVGEAAVGVAVSRDSRRAYVASMATGKVTAVDLETLTLAGSVQTGQAPDGLAWVGE